MTNKIFNDLLERAKKAKTMKQSLNIDNETWDLYDKERITIEELNKITKVLDTKLTEVQKKLNSGDTDDITEWFGGD
ncbi:hypothetical protein SAMN05443144_109122 [Fodinibius roseus]|uniref:Uncharacterized protein n=1 Tax=Fodinibius roseus TaxID=1194090 RepID=A0A1M5C6T8_9BACT|nr:hypothetical protein [Fodinibius roseus]SHF50484.1 hypothetical protein SAMN05443144_109122 [Fodinibius roseus]